MIFGSYKGLFRKHGITHYVNAIFGIILIVFAIFMGLLIAVFPIGFIAKIAVLEVLIVVIACAILSQSTAEKGNWGLMMLVTVWIIFHACTPTYISFKISYLPDISPYRLAEWLIVATVFYRWASSRHFRILFYQRVIDVSPMLGLLLAMLGWSLICSVSGESPLFSIVYVSKTWIFSTLFFVLFLVAVRTKEDIERIIFVALLAALFATAIGMAEWFYKDNLFRSLFPSDPDRMADLEWIVSERFRDGVYRVSSLFKHPLVYGEYLAMTLPFCLYFLTNAKQSIVRYCAILGLIFIPIGIYVSHTRSSIIASVAGVIVYMIALAIGRSKVKSGRILVVMVAAIAACALMIMMLFLTKDMLQGRTQGERGSSNARVIMFDRGITLIKEAPVFGYGPGTGASKIGKLSSTSGITIDNYFLSVALETGVPGLILYICILIVPFGKLFQVTTRDRAGLIAAILGSIAVYAIIRSVLSLTYNQNYWLLLMSLLLLTNRLPDLIPNAMQKEADSGHVRTDLELSKKA